MITETPEIAVALDVAGQVWPGETRGGLIRRLIIMSATDIIRSAEHRMEMVEQWAGKFPGAYGSDWDARRKAEWPQ